MLETKEVYGLVIVDRRDANIALLKGKSIIPMLKTHSEVPGKSKAGGQSAARFERLREGAKKDHFKKSDWGIPLSIGYQWSNHFEIGVLYSIGLSNIYKSSSKPNTKNNWGSITLAYIFN